MCTVVVYVEWSYGLKMAKLVSFVLLMGVVSVFGDGKFVVLTHPSHAGFTNTEKSIDSLEIPYVIANLFGIQNTFEMKWNGLLEGNPFLKPKAIALFSIFHNRTEQMVFTNAQKSYKTTKESDALDGELISHMIEQTTWEKEPLIVETSLEKQLMDIKSSFDGESQSLSLDKILEEVQSSGWFEKHNMKFLDVSVDADLILIGELYGITKVMQMLQTNVDLIKNPSPDFYHFKIAGLRALENKDKVKEAWDILEAVAAETTKSFKELYQDNVVVAAAALPSEPGLSVDMGRRLKGHYFTKQREEDREKYNQAPVFSNNYPVMFNIYLWVSIAFTLTMIGVAWGMWHMDPGRDSVIYRMTTQRLKRD